MRNQTRVSGGSGVLGSNLCRRLRVDGQDVVGADSCYSGCKDNVSHPLGNRHSELIRHDATFPPQIEVDRTCNLACPASPIHPQLNPAQTTKTGVRALRGKNIAIHGDGSRTRSFCCVVDLIDGRRG